MLSAEAAADALLHCRDPNPEAPAPMMPTHRPLVLALGLGLLALVSTADADAQKKKKGTPAVSAQCTDFYASANADWST